VLQVEQGSLYPALYRLEEQGWIKAEWGVSDNNRKAKFYFTHRRRPEATHRGDGQLGAARDRHQSDPENHMIPTP